MLIDYIDPIRLPTWLGWLDWCFYAYKLEFMLCISGGAVFWLIYCIFKNGYPNVG